MKGVVLDGNPETPRKLQELARHEFICKMLSEILMDVMICRQEGWDETEFIRLLHGELDGLMKKIEEENEKRMSIKNLEALTDFNEMAEAYAKQLQNNSDLMRQIQNNKKPLTPLAKRILGVIKEEKELTYAEAYAALDLVGKWLRLESNFVSVGK